MRQNDTVQKYCEATDDNVVHVHFVEPQMTMSCMCILCYVTKATNTKREFDIRGSVHHDIIYENDEQDANV